MILNRETLSMAEANKYLDKDSGSEIKGFIKKFVKITPEKAQELHKKLQELDLMKIKDEHIAKIIDILPENADDLNKIFSDIGLDEDEIKKILDTIKEYR